MKDLDEIMCMIEHKYHMMSLFQCTDNYNKLMENDHELISDKLIADLDAASKIDVSGNEQEKKEVANVVNILKDYRRFCIELEATIRRQAGTDDWKSNDVSMKAGIAKTQPLEAFAANVTWDCRTQYNKTGSLEIPSKYVGDQVSEGVWRRTVEAIHNEEGVGYQR